MGLQTACDRCTQGVMDMDNDHRHGRCRCICHDWEGEMEQMAEVDDPADWEWLE